MMTYRPTATAIVCIAALCAGMTAGCDDESADPPEHAALRGDLEHLATAGVTSGDVLGVGITVILAGGHELSANAGRAGPDEGAPLYSTEDTVQVIGSVTKMFTAALVMRLVEDGRLTLDATLDRWFAFDGAEAITVGMLLDHTSGLNDCLGLMPPERFGEAWSPEALVALATSADPYEAPGGDIGWYSNTNAVLLASIVEAVTGQAWDRQIAVDIAEPLGLGTLGYAGAPDREGTFARGWFVGNDGWASALDLIDPSIGWGAGALIASNRDMARFGRSLFDGSLFDDGATLAAMRTFRAPLADALRGPGEPPQTLGSGLIRYDLGGIVLDGHFGHILGYQAVLFHDPQTDAVIAVTANTEGFQVGLMAVEVAGAVRRRLAE